MLDETKKTWALKRLAIKQVKCFTVSNERVFKIVLVQYKRAVFFYLFVCLFIY